MSINLSDLTSPNNQDALAEITSAADFLDPIGKLENLSRSPNKGSHALQTVALNQPKALPLIDGDGYLYLSGVLGNYAETDSPVLPNSDDFDVSVDLYYKGSTDTRQTLFSQYLGNSAGRFFIYIDQYDYLGIFWSGTFTLSSTKVPEGRHVIRVTKSGATVTTYLNGIAAGNDTRLGAGIAQVNLRLGTWETAGTLREPFKGAIFSVTEANGLLNCDFTATSVRHNDKKLKCATGQIVTINQDSSSSNDVATIIKKPVLRFDGANSALGGLFNQTINSGYIFASFSVLGDAGEGSSRLFSINATGGYDYLATGMMVIARRDSTSNIYSFYNPSSWTERHVNLLDSVNGDILQDFKFTNGSQISRVNNADLSTTTEAMSALSSEEFKIGAFDLTGANAIAIDLEFLALFSADSVPDEATASKIRNYINSRNQIYLRHQTDGFYFFDPQKATFTGNFTGANTLDGYITGSDLGDTDVRSNLTLVQATQNDQPSTDGYTITFNDSAEHLEFENSASQNLSGWQVVGSSLGTFAYLVQGAVTTLNLLGNAGGFPTLGESYGIILLPASATGRDIEQARSFLIDRGAADGVTGNLYASWYIRPDIVEFHHIDTSQSGTNIQQTWQFCNNLVSFPALDLSNGTSFAYAWEGCSSMQNFNATRMDAGENFTSTWKDCSALTSFPADAKLGTEANNVSFSSAWRDSGLTSFPALDLSNATNLYRAWRGCNHMVSFGLVDTSSVTNFSDTWLGCTSLTSFPLIDTSSGTNFYRTWYDMDSVTDFPLLNLSAGRYFSESWRFCVGLINFPAGLFDNWNPSSIQTGVFDFTWTGCNSLTAQSVENILTSIDASGHYATTNKLQGGTALADAGIDIDYDGTTLSVATNAAIDSLSGKGWEVFINGVLVIPNILDLAPAAAYSLRSFDADADPNVVRVRRSSDGALSNFKASEVSDGTLTDWVNNVVTLSPTLNNGGFEDGATGYILGSNASIDTTVSRSGNNSGKLNVVGGAYTYFSKQNSPLEIGQQVKVSFWAKSSVADDSHRFRLVLGVTNNQFTPSSTDWEFYEVTQTVYSTTELTFARVGGGDFTIHIDDITVTNLTADGHVTTWYDQGGTNHATQTDVAYMPKIVDGGTLVTEGGLPALDFDGVDDHLFKDSVAASFTGNDIPISIFACFKETASSYSDIFSLSNSTSNAPLKRLFRINGYSRYDQRDNAATFIFPNGDFGLTNQILNSVTSTGNSVNLYEQGVLKESDTTDFGNFTLDRFSIGALRRITNDAFMNGQIQEIVVFNTDQSANRAGIENNINSHFTIYS